MLYIVSTPIGNLKDITLRGLEVLKSVALIAAEDTRHTRILTQHYEITTPLTSYFEHNKFQKADQLLNILREGKDVALVTDAGTPGISDPGFHLIRLARANDIPVTAVPGPCAFVAALTLSGMPSHRIIFEGFLPVKTVGRRKKLEQLKTQHGTAIFYESPYRLLECLEDIQAVLGGVEVAVARELTKKFEEVRRGTAQSLAQHFDAHKPKGEFVLLIDLAGRAEEQEE